MQDLPRCRRYAILGKSQILTAPHRNLFSPVRALCSPKFVCALELHGHSPKAVAKSSPAADHCISLATF
jgi:hypothetical protein